MKGLLITGLMLVSLAFCKDDLNKIPTTVVTADGFDSDGISLNDPNKTLDIT
jgi:hypothetical protein